MPSSSREGLVLSAALGHYRERAPCAPLRAHFVCTWFHRLPREGAATPVIVPDGCMDLQWVNGLLRIAGPDATAQREALPPGASIVGLRFGPAAAPAWLRTRACDLRDARVPLEALWGAEARRLAAWAGEAGTPEGIAGRLEAALAARAPRNAPEPGGGARLFRRLWHGEDDLATVCAELNLSPRTLRRRCHEWFGYGPRTLARVLRFQRFLRSAGQAPGASLAALAADAGYADQAHLTREASRLAGLTPATIRAQLSR
jgi:AraC-like DNA-binding protein